MTVRSTFLFIAIFVFGSVAGWIARGRSFSALRSEFSGKPLPTWTWCPRDVAEVTSLPSQKKFNDPADLKILCSAVIEDDRVVAPSSFTAVYRANGTGGQTSFIEYAGDGVFRADGKVFRSRDYENAMVSRR